MQWIHHSTLNFKKNPGGTLCISFFFMVIIVALRQLRLYGGLVNRSKSLKAFKFIDSNDPCLRFSGRERVVGDARALWRGLFFECTSFCSSLPLLLVVFQRAPHCAGPAGPEISKAVAQRCESNTKHLGQLADAVTGSEGKNLKHQYHGIGKQLHVLSDDVVNSSGAAQLVPVVQAVKDLVAKVATWQHHNIALKCHFYVWLWQCRTWFSTKSTTSCGAWTRRHRTRGCLTQISQKVLNLISDCPIDTVLLL